MSAPPNRTGGGDTCPLPAPQSGQVSPSPVSPVATPDVRGPVVGGAGAKGVARKMTKKKASGICISTNTRYHDPDMSKLLKGILKAVEESGETRYQIAKGSGVSNAQLSRVVRGLASLSIENVERLADYLGLEIVLRRRRRRKG